MSRYPRRWSRAFGSFNTNAVVDTLTAHTVIAAPGVGFALRIVGINFTLVQNELAANVFRFLVDDNAGLFIWQTVLATPNHGDEAYNFLPPGYQLPTNTPLIVSSLCTAVVRPFNVIAYYYLDRLA